jgi:superfamily II DNA or RNA helicase
MVLQCPTRGGKTEIAIEFCRRVGGKALWMTHLDTLMSQTPDRFMERLGVRCGIVQGKTRTDGQVVVGMVQTLSRMAVPTVKGRRNPNYDPDFFRQFDVLVVDESHHGGADTWQDVMRACTRAVWRLGLSGTVGDEIVKLPVIAALKIEGALGPTYTAATTMGLADLGFVAAPRVVMLRVPPTTYPSYEEVREAVCPDWRDDPRKLLSKLGGPLFREAYRRGVTENDARNEKIVETAVRHAKAGDRFLVLCNRVPHADALSIAIGRRLATAPVWGLDGEATSAERAEVLGAFKAASGGAVLICTPFFREGVDVPQIDAGLLAGGGESDVAVLQALGRMLTARADKDEVLIYDLLDGRDSRQKKDYLAQHRLSRVSLYERSGFAVERV